MAEGIDVHWARVATVVGGVVVAAIAARGVAAVLGVAFNEVRYQAGDPEVWMRRLR
jgi:hypothetical protein